MSTEPQAAIEIEMPEYARRPIVRALPVRALKIRTITGHMDDLTVRYIHPEDDRYATFPVSAEWADGRQIEAGDYYVVYADGRTSHYPAEAFEASYKMVESSRAAEEG